MSDALYGYQYLLYHLSPISYEIIFISFYTIIDSLSLRLNSAPKIDLDINSNPVNCNGTTTKSDIRINDKLGMDFIGKFENIQEDFNKICNMLKINHLRLEIENKSNHEHYSTYYDKPSREFIKDFCKEDIKNFGYKFELK